MLVTILTPTLNAERHLGDCLRSIAAQTHPRALVEHVVADGGSTDETVSLARAAGAVVDVGRDRSLYDALNRALRLAHGDVVGWLNADDVYAPDALARVVATFRANPDAELVVGDHVRESPSGRRIFRARADALQRIRRGARRWTWVTPLAVFFRTATLRELGEWLPENRVASDLDLWIRAAARSPAPPRVAHAGAVLGTFRIHGGSLSTGANLDRAIGETLGVARRWREDRLAPEGVRRYARYLERRYGWMQSLWTNRERGRARRALAALECWRSYRRDGGGAALDMLVPFE